MRVGGLMAALVIGVAAAGCSMNFPLNSFVDEPETTGTIVSPVSPLGPGVEAADWARASRALDHALDPAQDGAEARWDNPGTGAAGSFRADGGAFVRNDEVCRSFRASLTHGAVHRRLAGTACRSGAGPWVLRETKPVSSES